MEEAEASKSLISENIEKPRPQTQKFPTTGEHIRRKRRPQKPELGCKRDVIYVSTKTNTNALVAKCTKLINDGETSLTLYCLGAAIQRGILLALKLSEQHVTYKIQTQTFTTELIDDLEPAADDADYAIQRRHNSALKIRLQHVDPLAPCSSP